VDPNSAHAAYSTERGAAWPDWLADRTGEMLRRLSDRERSDEVAVHGTVRDLAGLPGITDARLVRRDAAATDPSDRMSVPAGPDRLLQLTGPATARGEVRQAARLVGTAIAGRLAGHEESRARLVAVRYALDKSNLRETQDMLRIETARLRTLMNSIHLAILVVDEQLRVAEVNTAALAMMQVPDEVDSVAGARLTDIAAGVNPEARAVVDIAIAFAQRSIRGRKAVEREEIRLPTGMTVEASYQPVDLDGRVRGHLLMGQDITLRVAAREALEAHNRELNELRLLKNEFVATVSHELRTPLTAASSLVEALADGGVDGPQHAEIVSALRRNTGRLTVIVEYLLMLARLESNRIPLRAKPVDTSRLVAERIALIRRGGRGDVTLTETLDDDPEREVTGDPDWLGRMVHYVIAGAVATAASDAELAVHSEVRDGRWTLTVRGAGLRLRDSGQVYSAVVSAGGITDSDDDRIGASLGILLAQAIAKRHGGEVVITQGDQNPRVTVSVPAAGTG
jgi:signal transduction histidine kinase